MTDIVEITTDNLSDGFQLAMSILNAGASDPGWIVETADVELSVRNGALNTCDGEFAYNAGASSGLDFVVDDGEAYVGGTWLARDTQSTVTLPASSTTTVYLGYDAEGVDTVIVGPASDFTTYDRKMPLYDVTTDGSSITGTTDRRTLGATLSRDVLEATGVGSEFNTMGFTGRTETPAGTVDQTNNEVWRAYGVSSDLIVSVEDGSSNVNLCYNAYFDGSWKRISDGPAQRISFESTGMRLYADQSDVADSAITWRYLEFQPDGSLVIDGVDIYDGPTYSIPKQRLGGPAKSLTGFPIPAGDIADGPGSGLDADTVDGLDASEIGGGTWTPVGTYKDTNPTTNLSIDTGTLATTYDQYRLNIFWEANDNDGGNAYLKLRINNDASSVYENGITDYVSGTVYGRNNRSAFERIAGTFGEKYASAEVKVTCIDDFTNDGYQMSNLTKKYPVVSCLNESTPDASGLQRGTMVKEIEGVTRLTLFSEFASGGAGTGVMQLFGRDINF